MPVIQVYSVVVCTYIRCSPRTLLQVFIMYAGKWNRQLRFIANECWSHFGKCCSLRKGGGNVSVPRGHLRVTPQAKTCSTSASCACVLRHCAYSCLRPCQQRPQTGTTWSPPPPLPTRTASLLTYPQPYGDNTKLSAVLRLACHHSFRTLPLRIHRHVQRVPQPHPTERRRARHTNAQRRVQLSLPVVHGQRRRHHRTLSTKTVPRVEQAREGQGTRHLDSDYRGAHVVLVYGGRPRWDLWRGRCQSGQLVVLRGTCVVARFLAGLRCQCARCECGA